MLVDARLAREGGIAREEQTGRRILKHGAFDALPEPLEIEIVDPAVRTHLRKKRFPAQTVVQGQPPLQSPGILSIERDAGLLHVKCVRWRLRERTCLA